jgi:hypothetical protein
VYLEGPVPCVHYEAFYTDLEDAQRDFRERKKYQPVDDAGYGHEIQVVQVHTS